MPKVLRRRESWRIFSFNLAIQDHSADHLHEFMNGHYMRNKPEDLAKNEARTVSDWSKTKQACNLLVTFYSNHKLAIAATPEPPAACEIFRLCTFFLVKNPSDLGKIFALLKPLLADTAHCSAS